MTVFVRWLAEYWLGAAVRGVSGGATSCYRVALSGIVGPTKFAVDSVGQAKSVVLR